MSYGVPTHGNGYKVDPQLTAQVRAQLQNNPAFLAWSKGYNDLGRVVMADPGKFGISLPSGAWIDSQGNVQTNPGFVSTALNPAHAWPLYAAATLGAFGSGGAFDPPSYVAHDVNSVADAVTHAATGGVVGGAAGGAAGTAAAAGLTGGPRAALKNPKDLASLVALIPVLKNLSSSNNGSNGNSPFANNSDLMNQVNEGLTLSNQRVKQAQPVYDSLVNMAYGRTPTRYRGTAPAGYAGDAAPAGAYQFNAPQFGGR